MKNLLCTCISMLVIFLSGCVGNDNNIVQEGFINSSDDIKIYYRILGTVPDTVVVLHGGPAHHNSILDLAPLSKNHTVIFYDQRGGGRSTVITDLDLLTWQHHVQDLEELRQHFGIERMKLIGVSWGAALASLYTDKHPNNVERMILAPPRVRRKPDPDCSSTKSKIDSVSQARISELLSIWKEAEDVKAVSQEYWSILLPAYYGEEAFRKMKSDFSDEPLEALRVTWDVWNATYQSLGNFDFRPMLREIDVPTLIVSGSPSTKLIKCFEWAKSLPSSRLLWYRDAGGILWVTKPDFYFPAANQFLNGEWPEESEVLYEKTVH
ncbi:alpha/beta fold hydrolase [bacterium]|nr:alpha/beta fold hydrolase [bacterium]